MHNTVSCEVKSELAKKRCSNGLVWAVYGIISILWGHIRALVCVLTGKWVNCGIIRD